MSGIPYPPPTEILPIFDDSVFQSGNDPLTYNTALSQFLRYPTAQGSENFVNSSTGENCKIGATGLSNIGGYDITLQSSNQINLNSNDNVNINCGVNLIATCSDNIIMTANNDSISFTADDNLTLLSSGLGNINLDAPNVNSYTHAMPICFTRERTDTFNYTLGGQTVESVYTTDFNIPYQFVSESPQSGYTSNRWKIDFALNCYNCSNLGDKGLALFIVFQDQASTYYLPFNYNPDTPYAKWQNPSSYSSPSYSQFQNFNWTDLIDLSGLAGTGSGNVPLIMTLAFAGDSGFSCNFHMTCTLTRTNLI